jgi:hypothetical protein
MTLRVSGHTPMYFISVRSMFLGDIVTPFPHLGKVRSLCIFLFFIVFLTTQGKKCKLFVKLNISVMKHITVKIHLYTCNVCLLQTIQSEQ